MNKASFSCLAMTLLLGGSVLTGVLADGETAHAGPPDPQSEARLAARSGAVRPLRQIEREVLPGMAGMQYLGPEYDPAAMAYRLKFIRQGRVVFVDVDARTGQIIHAPPHGR
ncbi:PepSY domain-containing protein [Novosphingobium terrae]|uniref:PepSY domain-containing protein n=1 Tax=Novosphingobium terrae TaxID=2726189 RepID=UPI001F1434F5|nr:PepSY domain-containing protein [Novosphingobium terrae]